jgi:porin
VAGLSLAYTRIASRARSYDRDLVAFQGFALPVRRAEAVIELTYQAVVAPGFTVQPDIQYIVSPGAHTWNLRLPGYLRIRNSAVFGLRGTILY